MIPEPDANAAATAGADPNASAVSTGSKLKRVKTVTDASGKTTTVTMDPAIAEKLQQADDIDKKAEDDRTELLKPLREKSDFMKIFAYNEPKWLIIPACLAVAAAGFC